MTFVVGIVPVVLARAYRALDRKSAPTLRTAVVGGRAGGDPIVTLWFVALVARLAHKAAATPETGQ
jgi:hypothetical protein